MKIRRLAVLGAAALVLVPMLGTATVATPARADETTFVGLFTRSGSWNFADTDAFVQATG